MSLNPVLVIGATGHVGNHVARSLRKAHPQLPLLLGVRDVARAAALVAELGNAEAVAIDLSKADLGLGDRAVSAVGIFLKDTTSNAARFARDRGVPFTCISTVMIELATDIATYIRNPNSTLVLSSEWLGGMGVMITLEAAKAYSKLDTITMISLLDPADIGGPAASADSARLGPVMGGAMIRENGAYRWVQRGENVRRVRIVDGTELDGSIYGVLDIQALAEATDAANIVFVFAVAETAGTKAGTGPSAEVIVELSGTDLNGQPKSSRHAMVSMTGQAPVTGFGAALVLERMAGLDGQPAPAHGLYFIENIITPDAYLTRAKAAGFTFLDL